MFNGKKLIPRGYQTSASTEAIEKNTIINIRTGGGKTLIAVIVIDKFLQRSNKVVCFLVPSRALVIQQGEYLRKNCSDRNGKAVSVAELSGQEVDSWRLSQWTEVLKDNDILVGTPEIFRQGLIDKGFFSPSQFSLLVFDECHNAVGKSPMASIMRDSVLKLEETVRPRILGLTASFVCGSTSNSTSILKKRKEMETLFQANICSPVIPIEDDCEMKTEFIEVTYPVEDFSQYKTYIEKMVRDVLRSIPSGLFDEMDKWVAKAWNIFSSLGAEGLRYWLQEGIVLQLLAKASELEKMHNEPHCIRIAKRMRDGIDKISQCIQIVTEMRDGVQKVKSKLKNTELPKNLKFTLPLYSEQIKELFKLLKNLRDNGMIRTPSIAEPVLAFKGIVFVEQVAVTFPLAYLINNFFYRDGKSKCLKCDRDIAVDAVALPVSGTGSMLDKVRNDNMHAFKTGRVPVLVSTNALEEGIDVPDCAFVIRFDGFSTTKAHIQGSGRARNKNARVYYFKNDPLLEIAKALSLDSIAKDRRLNLTSTEMKEELDLQRASTLTNFQYPYIPLVPMTPSGVSSVGGLKGGEVNFFNCLKIFYEYVQKVMKQAFDPSCLYDIYEEVITTIPYEVRRCIKAVVYPSPQGLILVDIETIDAFWGPCTVKDVVLDELLKDMSSHNILKRRAVYAVVVTLHKEGLLNFNNEPTPLHAKETGKVCPPFEMKNRIKLKNSFNLESLQKSSQFKSPMG